MYQIRLARKAKRQLKEIKVIYQDEIDSMFEVIKDDPYIGKPLSRDLFGKYSYRIGFYRIVYSINENDHIITILKIGHRSLVYR